MAKRILQFVNRELAGIHQAAFLLAAAGILTKLLALLRDRLLASTFGASRALDIYYLSFRLPDLLYTFSLFFAASTALIPMLLEKMSRGENEARDFINKILTLFMILILFIVITAFIATPYIIDFIAPGFNGQEQEQAALFTRILLLSPLLLGLSNIASSIIQSAKRFFVYALSPFLYNAGIIAGILLFYPVWGLVGVVWGVVLGAALHFLVQVPSVVSLGFRPAFCFKIDQSVKRALKLSFPRTLGISLNQIVLLVITAIASLLSAGSIAVFNFAYNLQSVPLTIFGLSYSVAAFPVLADSLVGQKFSRFLKNFQSALRHIIFWSLPIMFLSIVLRAQIIRVVLGAGNFDWVDTRLTAAAFGLFALSIVSQGLVMIYVRAFYAAGKTFLPVFINTVSAIFIVVFSFFGIWAYGNFYNFKVLFEKVLRVEGVEGAGMLVLPLIFSLGSIINIMLLMFVFRNNFGSFGGRSFSRSLFQIGLASFLMALLAYLGLRLLDGIFNLETFLGVFLQGFFAGVGAIIAGAGFLYLMGNKEFFEIKNALSRRIFKADVIVSEPEELP